MSSARMSPVAMETVRFFLSELKQYTATAALIASYKNPDEMRFVASRKKT
jgi:hypothetical protein